MSGETENPIAARIQELLDQRGETRRPLSDATGVSYTTISNWYKPDRAGTVPKHADLALIASHLETTLEYLQEGGDPPQAVVALREAAQRELGLLRESELRSLLTGLRLTTADRKK